MKYQIFIIPALLTLLTAGQADALDRRTVKALQACHDYLWNVPDFSDLPNAAITVYPATSDGHKRGVHWTVDWDAIKSSGSCEVLVGKGEVEIIGYQEDFKKHK